MTTETTNDHPQDSDEMNDELNGADSFRQGWHEAQQEETFPVATLWDDIEAE